jgi:enamine deaminase RidA (YjgF/YER057c/UK114 family)
MSNWHPISPVNLRWQSERLHCSPAVRVGDLVICSGVRGIEPGWNLLVDPRAQFERAFENLERVLEAAGASLADIAELQTFHVGLEEHMPTFMQVRDEHIREPYPAWTACGVESLPFGALVEIRAIAAINGKESSGSSAPRLAWDRRQW